MTLNTGNVGGTTVQVINLPPTTITRAEMTVLQFTEANPHLRNFVSKIFVRLGTLEVFGQMSNWSSMCNLFPAFLKLLQKHYPSASLFLCSVLPVEDDCNSAVTRQNVTYINSWMFSLCNPDSKIYYLNFYAMFIKQYGKNYGMFKDNRSLTEYGESMLLKYYQDIVQNKLLMIV